MPALVSAAVAASAAAAGGLSSGDVWVAGLTGAFGLVAAIVGPALAHRLEAKLLGRPVHGQEPNLLADLVAKDEEIRELEAKVADLRRRVQEQ